MKLIMGKHLKCWEGRQLSSIGDDEIEQALDAIEGKSARVHAFRVARTFFNWCMKPPHRYLRHSPLDGYEGGADRKRTRILPDDELLAVWNAAEGGSRPIFRLLILWGTRSTETTLLERTWVNDGVLVIPGHHDGKRVTKNGRDHAIPLLPLASSVLAGCPPGRFYFPGRRSNGIPIKRGSLAHLRRDIQTDSKTSGWGAHDLRRTFRSNMPRLGVSTELAERLINHVPGTLEETYDRHLYLPEKRAALAKYERFMVKLIRSGKT